jgi:anti-sigma B factor antagonist
MCDGRPCFALLSRLQGRHADLAVEGEIDLVTAPDLASTINGLIEKGYTHMILDLGGVSFMGATGLGVIASTAARLSALGGHFAIRSPRRMVTHLLDVADMSDVVRIEDLLEDRSGTPGISPLVECAPGVLH